MADRLSASRVKQVTDHICKLQDFVNSMLRLQVDEHEYAYLKAIVLFSPGELIFSLFNCLFTLTLHLSEMLSFIISDVLIAATDMQNHLKQMPFQIIPHFPVQDKSKSFKTKDIKSYDHT